MFDRHFNIVYNKHIKTSDFIKISRKALGYTQQQLAEAIKTNRYNITNYEIGRVNPPGSIILNIQELLKSPHIHVVDRRSGQNRRQRGRRRKKTGVFA